MNVADGDNDTLGLKSRVWYPFIAIITAGVGAVVGGAVGRPESLVILQSIGPMTPLGLANPGEDAAELEDTLVNAATSSAAGGSRWGIAPD